MNSSQLSSWGRTTILFAAFLGLLFDGMELGLMPVASLSVSQGLLGEAYTPTLGGIWFARYTAALLFGAAIGGVLLGQLGDRIGRSKALGFSILLYSVFSALGSWVQSQEQMLVLRFVVGLGVGGVWPNGMILVSECWPNVSRPLVTGIMSAGLNLGILLISQLARIWPVTPDSWKWLFQLAGIPALLGLFVLAGLPESPRWAASIGTARSSSLPLIELFRPQLRWITLSSIAASSIAMIGAWAASKWMIPWSDKVAGATDAGYKAATQGWWALGATLGSFTGAQFAHALGRRTSYMLISLGACLSTVAMFQWTAPLLPSFHPIVLTQGFVATLYFGWLSLYLPELFPTNLRATGSGLAYNSGRFVTAAGVLVAGVIFSWMGGDYPRTGALCSLVYALGLLPIWHVFESSRNYLND